MGNWIIHFTNSLKNTDLFSNKTPLCCLDMCNGSNNHTITPLPPWATRSTTLTSANRSPTRRHTSPSAICPVQWKPGFIREENTELGYDDELQTRTCRWASLRRFSDSLCRNSLVMQTDCCSSCPGGWSQTILEMKILDVEVLAVWLHVVCGCEAGWMDCQILWNAFRDGLW